MAGRRTQPPNGLVADAAVSVESKVGEMRAPGDDSPPIARRRYAMRIAWGARREVALPATSTLRLPRSMPLCSSHPGTYEDVL